MANIILDVDGTLWDSTQQVAECWNQTIKKYPEIKKELTSEELKDLFGKPSLEIFDSLFPDISEQKREEIAKACTDSEHSFMYTAPCPVFEGVKEGIEKLSKEHKLFIVSNCMSGYIEAFLQNTGLSHYMEDTLCFGDTGRPKGENLKHIMKKNALSTAVYVGDTAGDFSACQVAKIPFIFASYGFGKVPEAKTVIHHFSELLTLDFASLQAQ